MRRERPEIRPQVPRINLEQIRKPARRLRRYPLRGAPSVGSHPLAHSAVRNLQFLRDITLSQAALANGCLEIDRHARKFSHTETADATGAFQLGRNFRCGSVSMQAGQW